MSEAGGRLEEFSCCLQETADDITYKARLVWRPDVHRLIVQHTRWGMDLTCAIPRRINVTEHYRVTNVDFNGTRRIRARFEPRMSFFRDVNFRDEIVTYPLKVVRSSRLHVRVDVDAHNASIVLDSCSATPTQTTTTEKRLYLIYNR